MTEPRDGVVLLGLPTDEASSAERGSAEGPGALRRALYSEASNLTTENGIDLGAEQRFADRGDLDLPGGAATRQAIEAALAACLEAGNRVVSIGGDHSVTYPILRAYTERWEELTVVQIDAHPDLYDAFEGDRFSHACPFARIMEEGKVGRLVQIGIRTATAHQREQAERFGVEIVPRERWRDLGALDLRGPTYLSIDLDGFDPAFAPGVAHPEGGGVDPDLVLRLVAGIPGLVGADVVELNPGKDAGGITAVLAAKLVKELVGRLVLGRSGTP